MALTPAEARARLRGSIAPMVTPFHADGSLDEAALQRLIDWHIASGTHGISVTGTTGEPSSLSIAERMQVMEVAHAAVAGRVPFVPGTGSTNFAETIQLTRHAEALGADAAMVIVPYYNRPSQEGLYRHFRAVAESVQIPIIVYNIPGRTAVNLEATTLARLAKDCPNIVGVKESNKDFEHVNRVLQFCGPDFLLYSGIELLCFPMLAIGGAGHVSATANLMPREVAEIYNLVVAGQWEEARALHYRLMTLNDVLFVETNPGPLKYAMGLMGLCEPHLRLPLCEPSGANQAKIKAALIAYGLLQVDAAPKEGTP